MFPGSYLRALAKLILETPDGQRTNAEQINLARIFFKQGQFREAVDLLNTMSPTPAERIDVTALLGQSQFYLGSLDEARASLESVCGQALRPVDLAPLLLKEGWPSLRGRGG